MSLRVLLIPGPPPDGVIDNGVDRYLVELVKAAGDRVVYEYLEDPQFARGPERKWDGFSQSGPAKPKRRFVRLVPKQLRSLAGYIRDAWRLRRLLKPWVNKVDIIHVNRVGCEVQTIAARLAGFRRIISTIHNLPGPHSPSLVERLVEKISFACGDSHIAVARSVADEWIKRGMLSPRKVTVVQYGISPIDAGKYDRQVCRAHLGLSQDDRFIIGICARLHPMKGHTVLLEAFAELVRGKGEEVRGRAEGGGRKEEGWGGEKPENGDLKPESEVSGQRSEDGGQRSEISNSSLITHHSSHITDHSSLITHPSSHTPHPSSLLLLIAGEGSECKKIESKIAELGIGEHVRMLGRLSDAFAFYAALDLNVLPSISLEALPLAVIEAMHMGVPSVVSDVGGMKEIVSAGHAGVVIRSHDSQALAEAMLRYVHDADARRRDGDNARRYARANLTDVIVAQRTVAVYEKVMGKN